MAFSSLQVRQISSPQPNLRSHSKPASACYLSNDVLRDSRRATLQGQISLSAMYWLAACARVKLQNEADKDDHNLRLLVGHANLLDKVLPELEVDETAIELHLAQSKDGSGVSESTRKTLNAVSQKKQRIAVILNEVNWSEDEDVDMPEEAYDGSEDEDDMCIADSLSCLQGSERADFGVPLYRTKVQAIVCVDQISSGIDDKCWIEGSLGHDSNLVHLEDTCDVLKTAEIIEKIQL